MQLRNTTSRKFPRDSVPSLSAFRTLTRAQSVTRRFSVDPRTPRARLALATIASSRDSILQLAIRTLRQQSGSIPSEYPFRIVTPTISTLSQPRRLML